MFANNRYSGRLHELLRDFSVRLGDIDAIYRRTLAQERAQVQPQWWKRLWTKFWRRYTSDAARAMSYMANLDEPQVIDIASSALGGTLAAHRQFRERQGLKHAAAADAHVPAAGRSRNVPPSQSVSVELQEVVVHGCDPAAGTQLTMASQPRASARRSPAEESAVSASTLASSSNIRAVRTKKIIRALAPERKSNSDATPSVKTSRVEAVGAEDPAKMGGQNVSQDGPIATEDPLIVACLIARGSEGDVKQASRRRAGPNVKIELEEVVHSASRSGQREKEAPAADVAALKLQTSATAVDSTRSNLQLVRGASVEMKPRAHHSIKEDDFKLDKQRYEQVEARTALKQRTAASSAPEESDAHIRSVSSDDAPPMYPPPPFDEDDFKLAKRREEKAAARAALKQRAAAATVLEDSNAHAQRVCSDDAPPMYPPPPFDEDDFKLAKRQEEKAAARAVLNQTFTVATAFGSSRTKNSESTRFNSC